jgi:murein DD-endopeptidase MepM/ murein hydrolase activator NlpD
MALPVQGRVGSPFGWRWLNRRSDYHAGMDLGAPEGTPVHAVLPGVVVAAAPSGELEGYGNVVVLQHSPQLFSLYAHLRAMTVAKGEHVLEGATIGDVGRTAGTRSDPSKTFAASGAHLHLEFLRAWPPAGRDLDRIDPAPVLASLGIIVPQQGPLMLASSAPAQRAPKSSSLASVAAVLFLAALAWRAVQKQRPFRVSA